MQMRELPVPTLVLGVVAVWALLVAAAAFTGLAGRVGLHPDDPASVPGIAQLNLSQARTELPGMDQYADVAQRPLFNSDRRPLPPDQVADGDVEAAPPPSPLELTLTSVIISGEVKIAIVQDTRNQTTQSVRVGNNLEGDQSAWKLVELGPRKAVFEGPGGRTEADLRIFDGSGAQAPTALATPAAPPTGSAVAESGEQTEKGDGETVAVATETPESRAELIRRRIEERRRQMREAAARSSEPKKE